MLLNTFNILLFEKVYVYLFEKFMIAQNDPTLKINKHKYKLNFMGGTVVFKVTAATEIPKSHFQFVPFLEILARSKKDQILG